MRGIHSGVILVLLSLSAVPVRTACAKGKAASAGDSDITQACGSQLRTTKQLLNCAQQMLGNEHIVLPAIAIPDIIPSGRLAQRRTARTQHAPSLVAAAGTAGPTPFLPPALLQQLIRGALPLKQCLLVRSQLQTAVTRNQRWLNEHNRKAAAQNLRAKALLKDIDAYKAACPGGYQQSAACGTRAQALQARINKNDAEAEVLNEEAKQLEKILPDLIAGQKVLKATKCAAKKKEKVKVTNCRKVEDKIVGKNEGFLKPTRKCKYVCEVDGKETVYVEYVGVSQQCPDPKTLEGEHEPPK